MSADHSPPAEHLVARDHIAARVRLMRDGLLNYSGFLVTGLAGIILVPALLIALGKEQYGLWLSALALSSLLGGFDLGLGWTVAREVASSSGGGGQTGDFLRTARRAYLWFGAGGAVLIAAVGVPLSKGFHLSAAAQSLAPAVFFLVGLNFFSDQVLVFATRVLQGLRRFDTANTVSAAAALLRAAGILVLAAGWPALLPVVAWQAVATGAAAFVALGVVRRLAPELFPPTARIEWRLLRARAHFSLFSQFTTLAIEMVWGTVSLLIALVLGSAWIVPYYVGQRIPFAIAEVSWRLAQVLFPAAGESLRAQDPAAARDTLEVGTRWVLVATLPLCIVSWALAPHLLQAWIGEVRPDVLLIFRVLAFTVGVDAIAVSALHLLWGLGAVQKVLYVLLGVGAANLALSFWLMRLIGVAGAAWGMLPPMVFGSAAFLYLGARASQTNAPHVLANALRGLLLPLGACAAAAYALQRLITPAGWAGVLGIGLAAGAAYASVLVRWGAREEEVALIREIALLPVVLARFLYRKLRGSLRRIWTLRSTWYLGKALWESLICPPRQLPRFFNRLFREQPDPWNYFSEPEQRRFETVTQILDHASNGLVFRQGLEIGCGEGVCTRLLAERCESLLAVDCSDVALGRARQLCAPLRHVSFANWNVLEDPIPGKFDLVVAMGVLEYFRRPAAIRFARDRLAELLQPGGHLLLSSSRYMVAEEAWWGRRLLLGGKWINAFVAEHPSLSVLRSFQGDYYIHTLFRKNE